LTAGNVNTISIGAAVVQLSSILPMLISATPFANAKFLLVVLFNGVPSGLVAVTAQSIVYVQTTADFTVKFLLVLHPFATVPIAQVIVLNQAFQVPPHKST
jgi:hypothetical protein